VLYFYPKDNTPGCTTEACSFRDANADFAKRSAAVLGVSPDDEASHANFAGKFDLPFPLLADTDTAVCRKYGVWGEKNMYGRKFMGVVRTTYLIDPAGKVARRWDKVKVANHEADVLAALDECIRGSQTDRFEPRRALGAQRPRRKRGELT
jgi:peroxiredoxin Q/BCP